MASWHLVDTATLTLTVQKQAQPRRPTQQYSSNVRFSGLYVNGRRVESGQTIVTQPKELVEIDALITNYDKTKDAVIVLRSQLFYNGKLIRDVHSNAAKLPAGRTAKAIARLQMPESGEVVLRLILYAYY